MTICFINHFLHAITKSRGYDVTGEAREGGEGGAAPDQRPPQVVLTHIYELSSWRATHPIKKYPNN